MGESRDTTRDDAPPESADVVALRSAFDRLYSGATSDLREAMTLLHDSEQRSADLAAELARVRNRRAVRWADRAARTLDGLRRGLRRRR
jgi:hypothetical protein